MKKYIVTTTINPPTKATHLYADKEDWTLVVVGDTKTPHEEYEKQTVFIFLLSNKRRCVQNCLILLGGNQSKETLDLYMHIIKVQILLLLLMMIIFHMMIGVRTL